MGTCCTAHLATKARDYAQNAQNGAVTVTLVQGPRLDLKCDYCNAPAEFICTYYPKPVSG